MAAKVVKGTDIAAQIREELKVEVAEMKDKKGVTPGLVTILVGANPASVSYVTAKGRTAKELGFYSIQDDQPEDISQEDLLTLIDKYNADPEIHGILVQLPLPKHIDETEVLYRIDPNKDVDGFHPVNVGKLMIGEGVFLPCTPAGIQEMLVRAGVEMKGAEVVVVGRSNIVGKPIANMLIQKGVGANSTVTVCHTGTKDIAAHTKKADVIIAAVGVAEFIKADMISDGVAIIDVGVNRVGKSEKTGKAILKGDVAYDECAEKASIITPVPGGVGPMTITMLMKNTVKAAKQAAGLL